MSTSPEDLATRVFGPEPEKTNEELQTVEVDYWTAVFTRECASGGCAHCAEGR